MGKIIYGTVSIDLDDRTIVHLAAAVHRRLNRGDSFTLIIDVDRDGHEVTMQISISPGTPIIFESKKDLTMPINTAWINLLDEGGSILLLRPESHS